MPAIGKAQPQEGPSAHQKRLEDFLVGKIRRKATFSFASLFSGAGIGDFGLTQAGGQLRAACEIDPVRAEVLRANLRPPYLGNDVRTCADEFVAAATKGGELSMLWATPPCQSYSSAFARRGSFSDAAAAASDPRNHLFLYAIDIAKRIRPAIFVIENVPSFLSRTIRLPGSRIVSTVGEACDAFLSDYVGYKSVHCMSEFGVPQLRKRALAIYIRRDLIADPASWHRGTHELLPPAWRAPQRKNGYRADTAAEALRGFEWLDSGSEASAASRRDPLHFVPTYEEVRYQWIADIPPGSGRSAYENDRCAECGARGVPLGAIKCRACRKPMRNRPHVVERGAVRLIRGYATSYRRIKPDEPSATVTTASGNLSSDTNIHPFENRVLSPRECAHLQTIPDSFNWSVPLMSGRKSRIRAMIGEAVPAWFTYQLATRLTSSSLAPHLVQRTRESDQRDLRRALPGPIATRRSPSRRTR